MAIGASTFDTLHGLLTLQREIERIGRMVRGRRRRVAEQQVFCLGQVRIVIGAGGEDAAEIVMDRCVIVSDENSDVFDSGLNGVHARLLASCSLAADKGTRRLKRAPRPGPSLCPLSSPPNSLARLALACRPNP